MSVERGFAALLIASVLGYWRLMSDCRTDGPESGTGHNRTPLTEAPRSALNDRNLL